MILCNFAKHDRVFESGECIITYFYNCFYYLILLCYSNCVLDGRFVFCRAIMDEIMLL